MMRIWFLAMMFDLFAGAAPVHAQTPQVLATQDLAVRCAVLEGGALSSLPGAATYIVKAKAQPANAERQAYCSVEGYVNPSDRFGMYLPIDHWNGRYLVRGCGGSCGSAAVELACGRHVRDGYACLITDMGHYSTLVDNNWVDNNLMGQVDFGYRATHVTTVAGKALVRAFYGKGPLKSYFFACSTGGRQGLVEAQRFPEDFDGIVAIAPASLHPFGGVKPAEVSDIDVFNTRPDGRPILPNRKALLAHAAVVRQCDMNDGIRDGLIGDPRRCGFKPSQLLCKTADTRSCLTAAQVGVVDKLYGLRGAEKGSELNWIGNYLRDATLPGEVSKPVFDLAVGRGDPVVIETMIAPNNPDLRAFRDNNSRLILVHGWADHSVMPPPTIDYYETMATTMGGPVATRKFARLYMIPGMDHCSGGEGASAIDYMAAITAWVEEGAAPEYLHGMHPLPGAPLDYFGIDLPRLDHKWFGFERNHYAWTGPGAPAVSKPIGVNAPVQPVQPLGAALTQAITEADRLGSASGYSRRSILSGIEKAIWQTFYEASADDTAQRAGVAAIDRTGLSPVALEAVNRMNAELALD